MAITAVGWHKHTNKRVYQHLRKGHGKQGSRGAGDADARFIVETANGRRTRRYVTKDAVLAKKPVVYRCARRLTEGKGKEVCYRMGKKYKGRREYVMIEWENLSPVQRRKESIRRGYGRSNRL